MAKMYKIKVEGHEIYMFLAIEFTPLALLWKKLCGIDCAAFL